MSYDYRRSPTFDKKFKKLTEKDQVLKNKFVNKISQVLDNPKIGDFKRYDLNLTSRNFRRTSLAPE